MRKSVCFCLVLLCVLLLYSCGIPMQVYLGNDAVKERILTKIPPNELLLDTYEIFTFYNKNRILISYIAADSEETPSQVNNAVLLSYSEPIELKDLYEDYKDHNLFYFTHNISKKENNELSFTFKLAFDDNSIYSWESDEEPLADGITHIHFYAQYYVEDLAAAGKIESDITDRTYLGYYVVEDIP